MTKLKFGGLTALGGAFLLLASGALADERQIGEAEAHGMRVAAVYLQGVGISPDSQRTGPNGADLYLEADIHALKGNTNGFGKGEWVPYLLVDYVVTKKGGDFKSAGSLVPVTSKTWPHYGKNIQMAGPGTYHVALIIKPPTANGFYRHTDKETGVEDFFEPFTQEWDFAYAGAGK